MILAGRHAFWHPRQPMLTNGPYRTIPLRLGGSFFSFPTPFLGQDQAPASSNRLDALTITPILNRIMISAPIQRLQQALATYTPPQSAGGPTAYLQPRPVNPNDLSGTQAAQVLSPLSQMQVPWLSDSDAAVLQAVQMNPTPDELADLAIIDAFFTNQALTAEVCASAKSGGYQGETSGGGPIDTSGLWQRKGPSIADYFSEWIFYQPAKPNFNSSLQNPFGAIPPLGPIGASDTEKSDLTSSPFFCETPTVLPNIVFYGGIGNYANFFQIDVSQTWGDMKQFVKNAVIIMQVSQSYPFPPPLDQFQPEFWSYGMSDIQKLINFNTPLDPLAVKTWMTLFIVANYSAMVTQIQVNLKKEERRDKRNAMMHEIGLAIGSIIAIIALPAAIAAAVSAVKTAIQTYQTIEQQKAAAKAMEDTSKLFETDAPAFSQEADRTAKVIDEADAIQAASIQPTPDMQAAIQEVKDTTPSTGISPLIPIGGVAAAGLAALFIFR